MTSNETIAREDVQPSTMLGADLSPAVAAIEAAYRKIAKRYPGTPDATIVVKRDSKAWGHTTVGKVWSSAKLVEDEDNATHYEIMISGENLRRGPEFVLATLLHEAAHARNLHAGILDTDVNGRHNLQFKARAEEHGLTVTSVGWHGWTGTELSDEGKASHAAILKALSAGLAKAAAVSVRPVVAGVAIKGTAPAVEGGEESTPVEPRKRGNRNLIKAECGCGKSIRASRGVLEDCTPTCKLCGEVFAEAA
jgi:hypothetical protein